MKKFDGVTISQGKKFLRENWEEGCECPCCGQTVKLYPRSIYAGMAYSLIKLYWLNRGNSRFHHMRDIGTPKSGGGDFAKLVYWRLIEPCPDEPDKKKRTNGLWRITEAGRDFVERKIQVPAKKHVFNKHVYRTSEDGVDIVGALGKTFSYEELMGGAQ